MTGNYLKIVFVIDESGSMSGTESDVIGGFNGFIERQKRESLGEVTVSLYKFNEQVRTIFENATLEKIEPLSSSNYIPGGSTALLDAIGKAILATDEAVNNEKKEVDKVLMLLITDGMENASRRFSKSNIRTMIETHEQQMGWDFIYMGADLEDFSDAQNLGLKNSSTISKSRMNEVFECLSEETIEFKAQASKDSTRMMGNIMDKLSKTADTKNKKS